MTWPRRMTSGRVPSTVTTSFVSPAPKPHDSTSLTPPGRLVVAVGREHGAGSSPTVGERLAESISQSAELGFLRQRRPFKRLADFR